MRLLSLPILLCVVSCALEADTIYFQSRAPFVPADSSLITFTDQVTAPINFRGSGEVVDSSTPCDLVTAGCIVATPSVSLPTITLPKGQQLVSAVLELSIFLNEIETYGSTVVTPIDPTKPFTPQAPGGILEYGYATFATQAGMWHGSGPSPTIFPVFTGGDYSAAVATALQNGGILAPVTAQETFFHFDKGGSIPTGINSVTTYTTYLSRYGSGEFVGTLVVTTTPEPAAALLIGAGLVFMVFILRLASLKQTLS